MPWLRMLYKNKIKVYAEVDEHCMPVVSDGHVRYRYDSKTGSAEYSTVRQSLTLIPGAEPVELGVSVTKPPKPRRVPKTSVERPVSCVIPPNTIVAYTDGGASPNPGHAASGVLLMFGEHTLEIWEYLGKSTNNVAELTAILIALRNIKNKSLPIMLYSDSKYAIGVLTGTMRATKNLDLIAEVREEMERCQNLQILKVKAHVGIAHNEHVDRLVALARDTRESGMRRDGV